LETIFLIDLEGRIILANEEGARRYHTTLEKLKGANFYRLLKPAMAKQQIEIMKKVVDEIKSIDYEFDFEGRIVANIDQNEAIWIIRDISEQRQMESEIRKSEEKYRVLIGSLNSVVATIDEEGHFLYINDIAACQLGSKPEDVIGKTIYEIFPPNASEPQMQAIRQVFRTNKGVAHENISYVQGEPRWYRSMIEPIHDENGKVTSVLLNSADIHDLKIVQENLLKLNETLEQRVKERTAEIQDLYDNSPTGYHTLGIDDTFQRMNGTEMKWLGYTSDEITGNRSI
jgi:PAS domain S-box-containing protein